MNEVLEKWVEKKVQEMEIGIRQTVAELEFLRIQLKVRGGRVAAASSLMDDESQNAYIRGAAFGIKLVDELLEERLVGLTECLECETREQCFTLALREKVDSLIDTSEEVGHGKPGSFLQ